MNPSSLDINALALTPFPDTESGMVFSNVRNNKRQLVLKARGTIVEPPFEYFGDLAVKVQLGLEDTKMLLLLENMIEGSGARVSELGLHEFPYDHRPTLTDEMQLLLKLKTKDGAWRFTTNNAKFTPESHEIARGVEVHISFSPSFYFDREKMKYGLFYSLKELEFGRRR